MNFDSAESVLEVVDELAGFGAAWVINKRDMVADEGAGAELLDELGEVVLGSAVGGCLNFGSGLFAELLFGEAGEELVDVDTFVPNFDCSQLGESGHVFAVAAEAASGRRRGTGRV